MPSSRFERDLNALRRNQYFLYVLIFSLATVLIWVVLSIFQSQRVSQIDPELKNLAEPLNPNLDQSVLKELAQKKAYTAQELQNFSILKIVVNEQGLDTVAPIDLTIQPLSEALASDEAQLAEDIVPPDGIPADETTAPVSEEPAADTPPQEAPLQETL